MKDHHVERSSKNEVCNLLPSVNLRSRSGQHGKYYAALSVGIPILEGVFFSA